MLMLKREDGSTVIRMDSEAEPRAELYWRMIDTEMGYMERIRLPHGGEVCFNQEVNKIDFEPMKEYIGVMCDYYVDGVYRWSKKLLKIEPNEDGVNALWFEKPEDEGINYDLHPGVEMDASNEGI